MRRRVHSRISIWLVAALVVTFFFAPSSATAEDPVPTYFIEVAAATLPYGQAPVFVFKPVYAALPPGSSLIGKATCSQVFTPGQPGATQSVYGTGGSPLHPGSYQFVQSSCQNDDGNPLKLSGLSDSNYHLQIVAGTYTVEKGTTAIGGAGFQGTVTNGAPTPTVLTATVFDTSGDVTQLAGKTVTFDVQLSNGVFLRKVCEAVTSDSGSGDYLATCRLSDQYAKALYDGAGTWVARFAGDADYNSSIVSSTVGSARLTPAEVVANLNRAAGEGRVTLVPVYVPPECDSNPYTHSASRSILEVSLGLLNCEQLEALQITTTIVFGIATSVIGGEATYQVLAYNAAQRSIAALKFALNAAIVVH